ncbi:methylcitrate synthase, partial [Cystoisospora suis]
MDFSAPFWRKKIVHNHKAFLSGLFTLQKTVSEMSVGLNRRIPFQVTVTKQRQQRVRDGLTNRNGISVSLFVNADATACSYQGKTDRSPFASVEEKSGTCTPKLSPFLTEFNHLNGRATALSRKNLGFSDYLLSRLPCVLAGSSSSITSFTRTHPFLLSRLLHSSHGLALGRNQRAAEKLRDGKTETPLSSSLDPPYRRKSRPGFSDDAVHPNNYTPWSSSVGVVCRGEPVSSCFSPSLFYRQLAEKRRKAREDPEEGRSFTTSARMEESRSSNDKDVHCGQQLKEKQFSPGLEGIIAGESSISTVNENSGGLSYRGYRISDLSQHATFNEVAFLLLHGYLPTREELREFQRQLYQARKIPQPLKDALEQLPKESHPMDVLRTACSILGMIEPEVNPKQQQKQIALRLMGAYPSILFYWYNFSHYGLRLQEKEEENQSDIDTNYSIASRFLHLLHSHHNEASTSSSSPSSQAFTPDPLIVRAVDLSLILYAEHDFN